MALDDVAKLLLVEFRLNFDFEYAFFGQVCIYPRVACLDDLVNVALHHWVSDWDLLDLLGVIHEVQDLCIGSDLANHQDMLIMSMQAFNLVRHLLKMNLFWLRRVLEREYHDYFVASQA
jgi:hypothetical protein